MCVVCRVSDINPWCGGQRKERVETPPAEDQDQLFWG